MLERSPHRAGQRQDTPAVDDVEAVVEKIEQASLLDLPAATRGMPGQQALRGGYGLRVGVDAVDACRAQAHGSEHGKTRAATDVEKACAGKLVVRKQPMQIALRRGDLLAGQSGDE